MRDLLGLLVLLSVGWFSTTALGSHTLEARFTSNDHVGLLGLRRLCLTRLIANLTSPVRTMLGFLDLRRPCFARSLAKLASLARVEADLAWRLFGKCSLLGFTWGLSLIYFSVRANFRQIIIFCEYQNLR